MPEKDYTGYYVANFFNGDLFYGMVKDWHYNNDNSWYLWHIHYDDNDVEDIEDDELMTALKLFQEIKR
jgi:hypothetical protein